MNKRDALNALLRHRLDFFVARVFQEVSPHDPFQDNWHILAMCHQAMRCLTGDGRRHITCLPPRNSKSITLSVAFTAYALGLDPTLRIICASYSDVIARRAANQTRQVVASDWYQQAFPNTRIHPRRNNEREFQTTRGGGRFMTSVDGPLTGQGADLIVIDDAMNVSDAFSQAKRDRAFNWIKGSVISRLNDKRTGAIMLVGQRVHDDDPIGRLIEEGGWDVLCLPAIATDHERVEIGPGVYHEREPGDLLHPERESRETLEDTRRELGSNHFSAQYQQMPIPAEGSLVQRSWLRYYDFPPSTDECDWVVQSWDTASVVDDNNSYSVCTTWGVIGDRRYLLDVWRRRVEFPDLLRSAVELARRWSPTVVLVEKAASGNQLLQVLRREHRLRTLAIPPRHSKEDRMAVQTPAIEAGEVLLPEEAVWLADYVTELLAFPGARYSDQVDSTSQALGWIDRRLHRRHGRRQSRRGQDAATANGESGTQSGLHVSRGPISIPFSDDLRLL